MRGLKMNLRRLQAFRAVFEPGSVTGAAQRLHMTQPAVSRLICDLERELGLGLFARQRQRLVPHEGNRSFFRGCERAPVAGGNARKISPAFPTLQGATFRVGMLSIAPFG